jgi:hypothetical protein
MKPAHLSLLLIVVIGAGSMVVMYLTSPGFFLQLFGSGSCQPGDEACLATLYQRVGDCVPSVTEVTGEGGIRLRVTIYREGDRCVRLEEVLSVANGTDGALVGYNVSCGGAVGDPKAMAGCNGSLMDYVAPAPAGQSPAPQPQGPPFLHCSLNDDACKQQSENLLQTCQTFKSINTDLVWEPIGYWTLFFDVARGDDCIIYIEVLNAANIPESVPEDIVGYNLTCEIPLDRVPVADFERDFCSGPLLEFV